MLGLPIKYFSLTFLKILQCSLQNFRKSVVNTLFSCIFSREQFGDDIKEMVNTQDSIEQR